MESQRAVFLFLLLLFIFLTPDQAPRRRFRFNDDRLVEERKQDFDVLANATYGAFDGDRKSLNITGFREGDGYQWGLLGKTQERSREQWTEATRSNGDVPFYREVSGEVRGEWTRSALSSTINAPLNLTHLDPRKEYISRIWSRNVTEDQGEISLTIHDDEEVFDGPRGIKSELALYSDSSPGNGWQILLRGVHFPGGHLLLSTSSSKFDALPALPQFALSEREFEQASEVMNRTVAKLWERKMNQDPDLLGLAHCEVVIFLQPRPIVQSVTYLQQIESELAKPEGAPIGIPPPLSYSAVVFSPDCGYVLEAENLFGPKQEAFAQLTRRLLVAFIIILGLQIFLLKRQMEKASTPSTRSRISYQSIVIAALGDGLILLAMIGLLMISEVTFLAVAATTYLACIHVAFLEVKFVFDIWNVQVGEPMRAEAERQRRDQRPAPPTEIPLPATAPRPTDGAVPIIVASDGELDLAASPRASFAAIYTRFYFTLVMLMFISLWATSWPEVLRSTYTNLLVIFYFSLWWPQVYRNIMRNCRKSLSWEYVVGSTLLRVIPVLYWYFAPRNVLGITASPSTAYLLLAWLWLQVLVLLIQQYLGPRLLIPPAWCPPAYDYHPMLHESDSDIEVGAMSIGLLASASEGKDKDDKARKVFDCAICMNEIDVPVVKAGEAGRGSAWLEQRKHMVTPCRHIFHTECLEGWMNLRLVCPVCREALPPL
jgi:transmembrane E3 ubiquitin-protein ligase